MGRDGRGVILMIAAMAVFAAQDGVSKHLVRDASPVFLVAVRYWAFAAFVMLLSARLPGGLRAASRSRRPFVQCLRGVILVVQICVITFSFDRLGLAESHALMASYPLMIAVMAVVFLGERAGVATWAAIGLGFIGVLVLLRPGDGVFDPVALLPLLCAAMFATYGVLTRVVGRVDASAVSFFYTGVAGAVAASLAAPFFWTPLHGAAWAWMAVLCVTGAGGHYLLIKAYEASEAATLQPFAFLQLLFVTGVGVVVFGETIDGWMALGAGLVVAGGLVSIAARRRVGFRRA